MAKYFNKAIKADGEVFDSKKEYKRWKELCLLERAGKITDLRRQVRYMLFPSAFEMVTDENGRRKRVCVCREISYIADFVYHDENGELVCEDCKGFKTDVYKLKKKLMYHVYKIKIKET